MRGIAEGASDAGAKWLNRRIDLMDIVVANVTVELGTLASAVATTATGLEGLSFDKPRTPAANPIGWWNIAAPSPPPAPPRAMERW